MVEARGPAGDSALAHETAGAIVAAFARYNAEYRVITRRAPERFENRDWSGVQADVVERLDLYSSMVDQTASELRQRLEKFRMAFGIADARALPRHGFAFGRWINSHHPAMAVSMAIVMAVIIAASSV